MENSREELTDKIIGLGSKSIRKNYYPELKQRIKELNRSLQWQIVLQEILEDLSSCLTMKDVFRKFLDHFLELNWVDKKDCVFIKYLSSDKISSISKGVGNKALTEQTITARSNITCDPDKALKFPLKIDNKEIASFYFEPAPGHELTESEKELIETLLNSILPTLKRIYSEYQRASLELQLNTSQKVQALGTLANGIAHDFNNILSSIFGYSELALSETDPSGPVFEYLEQILKSAKRAKGLTDQILSFSRMKAADKQIVNLKQSIKDSVKMIRAALPSNILFELDLPEVSPFVEVNTTNLHQVFMNICANASHAMKDNGGSLYISLDTLTFSDNEMVSLKKGNYAHVSIRDTGKGMTAETLSHIFEPYFTTKKEGEGTGLGLSVVYGIISSMKGEIKVYSEPGAGSVFHIYFPVSEKEEKRIIDDTAAVYNSKNSSEQILLLDDDEAVRNVLNLMLESLGYRVEAFASPLKALERFISMPDNFDLIITDMTMPEMTGDIFAEHIIENKGDQKIILISGFSEKLCKENKFGTYFKDCLIKPVLKNDLAKSVRFVLDMKS